jgi:exonuclease VII small subunit
MLAGSTDGRRMCVWLREVLTRAVEELARAVELLNMAREELERAVEELERAVESRARAVEERARAVEERARAVVVRKNDRQSRAGALECQRRPDICSKLHENAHVC